VEVRKMRLDEVEPGKTVKVVSIEGGRGVRQRLLNMGILPGEVVKVVRSAPLFGPLMVSGRSGTFFIGRGMARKILVEEVS
jgi:Fe2+ transport system protein FeoA